VGTLAENDLGESAKITWTLSRPKDEREGLISLDLAGYDRRDSRAPWQEGLAMS
jgi:hypothetical protein